MGYCSDFEITIIPFDRELIPCEILKVIQDQIDYSGEIDFNADYNYSLGYFNVKFRGYKKSFKIF